ncbi:MAG: HPr(Ser) kinase/phosphatase [Candidatus Firestonebacteria bacterium]
MALTIKDFIAEQGKALKLTVAAGRGGLGNVVGVTDVNRCGLALTGYFDFFPSERIQVLGKTEVNYLEKLPAAERRKVISRLFRYRIPVIFICRGVKLYKEIVEYGNKRNIPVILTPMYTTRFISEATNFLEERLAEKITMHGVMVDIYGVGVVITGKSGTGKSECALELIKRGHRLVADDIVEVIKTSENRLIGSPQKLLTYFLEVRGLGIVNVKDLFGVGATRDKKRVEMAVHLEEWDNKKHYDRTGLSDNTAEILGVKIPKIIIPVKPGRNIAIIMEVAAMQERLKKMGYSSAAEFENNIQKEMKKDGEKGE